MIAEQAAQGRMFTPTQFAAKFENRGNPGGKTAIRDRLHVLATKGYVKCVRGEAAKALDLASGRIKHGYLCVEGMHLATGEEVVDPETGELTAGALRVLPTHFMCPQTGALLPVENAGVWVDQDGGGYA